MRWLSSAAILLLVATPAALSGQGQSPLPFDFSHPDSSELGIDAPNAVPQRIRYGAKGWQEIFFYPANGRKEAPLVIGLGSVDVRGWSRFQFNHAGFAFAAIPNVEREPDFARKSLGNYAAAIAKLYGQAEKLGIDRTRIVLLGADFGADIAALFGTDPAVLGKAGVPFESLRGVVLLDGEDFDLVRRSAESKILHDQYRREFTGDSAELAAFSPMTRIALPNAPAFLLLASEDHIDAIRESEGMTQSLTRAGTAATFQTLPHQRKGNLETLLLAKQGGAGWQVIDFLQQAFAMP